MYREMDMPFWLEQAEAEMRNAQRSDGLCQLPGPASSQVGIAGGIFQAGLLGGLASWI